MIEICSQYDWNSTAGNHSQADIQTKLFNCKWLLLLYSKKDSLYRVSYTLHTQLLVTLFPYHQWTKYEFQTKPAQIYHSTSPLQEALDVLPTTNTPPQKAL